MLTVVADENLAGLSELFAPFARLRCLPGRAIEAQHLRDADALLTRSVTPVGESLLRECTRLGFVGTATIGVEHIDQQALQRRGIAFASAPGCNAAAVGDYVLSAILAWSEVFRQGGWQDLSVGLVGAGNVGWGLAQRLQALGLTVKMNDPPLAFAGKQGLATLEEVLACDVVSLHVPLQTGGEWPTRGLIAGKALDRLGAHQLLINTARGGVIDEAALIRRLNEPDPPAVVLDTWQNEPDIDKALAARVWLATPHIAGYSREGRLRGSWMVQKAFCNHFGLSSTIRLEDLLPPPVVKQPKSKSLIHCLGAAYDIKNDSEALKTALGEDRSSLASRFDELRRHYPMRAEFSRTILTASTPERRAVGLLAADG